METGVQNAVFNEQKTGGLFRRHNREESKIISACHSITAGNSIAKIKAFPESTIFLAKPNSKIDILICDVKNDEQMQMVLLQQIEILPAQPTQGYSQFTLAGES